MNPDHMQATIQAIEYMKLHLDRNITTEQLADLVGYSPYHFTRVFKAVTGISPRHYLSALRIEAGKKSLLSRPTMLAKILISLGFTSAGSFNTRFKQYVGISPQRFRAISQQLSDHMNQYKQDSHDLLDTDNPPVSSVHCHIDAPEQFHGLIFVGLFPRPIPDQRPVAGTALKGNKRDCTFSDVPSGTYYALAAGIPWSLNPRSYFVLDHALRGKHEAEIVISPSSFIKVRIELREPLPYDPPILISLPLLLFEQNRDKRAK